MEAVRKKYDREFKLEAIRLADKPGAVVPRVGRDLGLYHGTIRHWHEELQKDPAHTFMGTGHLTPLKEENHRLKRENRSLREERKIVKKRWSSSATPTSEVRVHGAPPSGVFRCRRWPRG